MPSQTIREFLVALSWDVKSSDQKRFVDAIEHATLKAKLMGDAIEATALKVTTAISGMAESFDKLYFMSQRTGATVETIRSMGYAASQMGSSVGDASAAVEILGQKIRSMGGGGVELARRLGFNSDLSYNRELGERFAHMSTVQQEAFGLQAGLSETMIQALRNPERFQKLIDDAQKSFKASGIGPETYKAANDFMTQFRSTWMSLDNIADGGLARLLTGLTPILQDFDNFLKANQGEISKDLNAIADAIVRVLKEFEEWLTKGGGFKKIGDALESFGTAVKSVTDSMGGMQRAFEIFFLFWAGGKVIAAVELIGKLATSLALIGRLGVLAQIPFLGGDTNAPDPTPQQYKDAKAKEKAIIDGGGGFWSGVGKMFGFGGAPPAPAGGPPHAGVAPHAGGGAPPSAPAGAGAAINSGWGAVSNWWGANAPTWLGGNAAAGAAGANGVLPAPVGNNLPRNLRNKNPGNVIDGAWAARQPGYAGSDGHFAIFDTMENGYRAANKNVDSYASRGVRTPMQILNLWAPGSSGEGNDPAAYASSVQRKTGLDPNAPVGTDPDSRARMLRGITEVEAGRASPYTDAQISAALGGAPVVPAVVAQPPATVRTPGAFGFDPFGRAFAAPVQPYGGLQDYFHTPLGADGGGGGDVSHINAPQQTTIHIDGANDPSIVAHMVAANQSRIASDMARTLQGATQ